MCTLSRLLRLTTLTIAGFVLVPAAMAGTLKIGAMPVGTGWYVAAVELQKALDPVLRGASVEVLPRGGGVANPMVVQQGKADIALSNVATSVWARNGTGVYAGQKAPDIRALVGGLNPVYMSVMVRNAFIKQTGLNTLDKILNSGKPLRIVMKPNGSNVPPTVDLILGAYGLSRDKIKANGGTIIQVNASQIPDELRDGRVDIYFDTVLKGHPTISEVSLTADVRFLDLPKKVLDVLAKNGLKPAQIPQWFKGQSGPTWGADFGTEIIASKNLSDDLAYEITKTTIEKMRQLAKAYPAWAAFKPQEACKPANTGIPLHPGAIRYYKESGCL